MLLRWHFRNEILQPYKHNFQKKQLYIHIHTHILVALTGAPQTARRDGTGTYAGQFDRLGVEARFDAVQRSQRASLLHPQFQSYAMTSEE